MRKVLYKIFISISIFCFVGGLVDMSIARAVPVRSRVVTRSRASTKPTNTTKPVRTNKQYKGSTPKHNVSNKLASHRNITGSNSVFGNYDIPNNDIFKVYSYGYLLRPMLLIPKEEREKEEEKCLTK